MAPAPKFLRVAEAMEAILLDLGWSKVSVDPPMWTAPRTNAPRYTTELAVHRATLGVVKAHHGCK